jgi:hypothetical protein
MVGMEVEHVHRLELGGWESLVVIAVAVLAIVAAFEA